MERTGKAAREGGGWDERLFCNEKKKRKNGIASNILKRLRDGVREGRAGKPRRDGGSRTHATGASTHGCKRRAKGRKHQWRKPMGHPPEQKKEEVTLEGRPPETRIGF